MVNEENKKLLEEINNINKSNKEKEENLKWQIWRIAGQTDTFWYKQLNKKWFEEGKLRTAKDINNPNPSLREYERVYFDNITIEEMLEQFCDHSKELASTCANYISEWSQRGYRLTEQKREYEEKIKNLKEYSEYLERDRLDAWKAEDTHVELANDIVRMAMEQNEEQVKVLKEELGNNKTLLTDFTKRLTEEKTENQKLSGQLEEREQALENLSKELVEEKQKNLNFYLNKPLPKLPSKFKIFKENIKVKSQQLVEKFRFKKQVPEQKFIARIEVKIGGC